MSYRKIENDYHYDNDNIINNIDNIDNSKKMHRSKEDVLLMYDNIVSEYGKEITPTIQNVKQYLKKIIKQIDSLKDEKKPEIINLDELSRNISNEFPKSKGKRIQPIEEDHFYKYIGEYLVTRSSTHLYYETMASIVEMNRIHAITTDDFKTVIEILYNNYDTHDQLHPLISDDVYNLVINDHERLQKVIDYDRDYDFDYFGIKTLEKSYLFKLHHTKYKTIERPQHLFLRVALGIHSNNYERVIETYNILSERYMTHATPTLFNAGTPRPQMSSCFLQSVDDSLDDIFSAITDIANISKWSGGIGIHLSSIRARGSLIRKTNGVSDGIIPLCVVLNKVARYINQGGKRKGSIACFCQDTEVFTLNGGVKKIQDVVVGDLVMTHKNRAMPVVQIHKNPIANRSIYRLNVENNKEIYVTGNHRFWSSIGNTDQKTFEWHTVEELKDNMDNMMECYVSIPCNDMNVADIKIEVLGKKWEIIDDMAKLIGIWFGCGYISNDGLVGFNIPNNGMDMITYITQICKQIFNSDVIKQNDDTQLLIESDNMGLIMRAISESMFRWPRNLVERMIEGLLETASDKKTIRVNNQKFANQLYHFCRNNGFAVSINGMGTNMYELCFPSTNDRFLRIRDIMTTDRTDEMVYTLGVQDDHSYAVEGLLVENCYLEPWHADIFEFCELRLNTGTDDIRARDLYLALWVPSLFVERVKNDEMWSLMCPDVCPGLNTAHSEQFNELYERYEREGRYKKQVKARDLWKHILAVQTETGFPYMLYKDNANKKSNQQNLGTIRSSNLCAEVIEYSDKNETAVCNLASLCLPRFIKKEKNGKSFDHQHLIKICRVVVRNLDQIIDLNFYPTEKTKLSNMRHRPIGIGIQGLADLYNQMGYAYDSKEAIDLNKRIFETIYYAVLDESNKLAIEKGAYSSFEGSPFSKGLLQFHLWGKTEADLLMGYDWKELTDSIKTYGTRNSLLTALMPTASTSQIMGNSECIEPYMSNIFTRSTLAGQFIVVNKNLMRDLIELDLWNDRIRKLLIIENGSVQNIDEIPANIKSTYKTAFETSQKILVKQSADRGIFIDQSQSLNVFMKEPNFDILNSILIDGHDIGLKTGMYYYRTLPAVNPINFGIDINEMKELKKQETIHDMISGMYNIDEQQIIRKKKGQKNDDAVCKWKPGMKLEDCTVCSA